MKRNIYLLCGIAFLQGMVFYAPVAALYRQAQGITLFQITQIESISLALCILLEVTWGFAAERIGYRKTMIICCSLYFVSKIIFWQAENYGMFLLERILLSIVTAGMSGVDAGMLYVSCDAHDAQRIFGFYHGAGMAGLFAAAVLFAVFIQEDYALAAFLTVVSYAAAMLLSFFLCEVKEQKEEHASISDLFREVRTMFHSRRLLALLLGATLLGEAHQSITVFLNQVSYVQVGLDDRSIGLIYIVSASLGIFALLSSFVSRHLGPCKTMLAIALLAALACIVLSFSVSALTAVGSVFVLRMVHGIFQPLQMELQNKEIKTDNRAAMLSAAALFMEGAAIMTNLCFGWLSQVALSASYMFGAAICMSAFILFAVYFILHGKNV